MQKGFLNAAKISLGDAKNKFLKYAKRFLKRFKMNLNLNKFFKRCQKDS